MLDRKQNTIVENLEDCSQNNYVINTSLLSCSLNNQNSSNKKLYQNKENINNNMLFTENSQNNLSFNQSKTSTNNNNPISNLFMAVEYNDLKKASELLNDPQIQLQINDLNEEGISVLHIAVIKANLKMIDLLLSNGADPDILTYTKNQSPLHLAYLNQNSLTEEIIKELLNHHANENILDNNHKKPADYMTSSYKKNLKINNNNYINANGNVDTGNTVTVITMDNHLDSFLTTNKEEDNKSVNNNIMNNVKNTNTNNSNNNSIINNSLIQTPTKIYSEEGEFYCNDVVSQKKFEEKNNNNINNNVYNIIQNNDMVDGTDNNRRQYTFGKEEDYLKFQGKNFVENIDTKNLQNNSDYYMKFGKNVYVNEKNKISNENLQDVDNSLFCSEEKNINNQKNQNFLAEKDYSEENNSEIQDKYNDSLENEEIQKSNNNINLLNNNNQESSIYNNSILTYSNSCIRSKIKVSPNEKQSPINEINNINDIKRNAKTINVDSDQEFIKDLNVNYLKENNEFFFKKIIQKKRDSVKKNHKINPRKRFSSNLCENQCQRLSTNKTSSLDVNNFSLQSNRIKFVSPIFTISENDNINHCTTLMRNKEILNTNNNNSYRNNTIIHNVDTQPKIHAFSNSNNSQYSTQSQNIKAKFGSKDKIKVIMDQNIDNKNLDNIPEFDYMDNNSNTNNNTYFYSKNYNNSNLYSNTNEEGTLSKTSCMKYWLNNIGLICYYENFASNSIYDIYKLINQMKSYETKLKYEDFDNYLKIRVPGHVYRILCRLETDAGLIDNKIIKFMLRDGIFDAKNIYIKDEIRNSKDLLKLSISQDYQCINCCRMNSNKKLNRKNDLKSFLKRYGILNMYQNFYHNGFEMIEYVILQMYSSMPINDEILENHFHIYDENLRSNVLKSIVYEMKKINEFLNSGEYNNYIEKDKLKYENVVFVADEEGNNDKIDIRNNGSDNGCNIY